MTIKLPNLFRDSSNSDKGEEIIDYFVSWTLRCSMDSNKKANENVQMLSKRMMSFLCFDDPDFLQKNNHTILDVKVWKQKNYVDVWAEVEIEGFPKKIALIIENKMYSGVTENQLKGHKKTAKDYYKDKYNFFDVIYIVIRPDYTINLKKPEKEICSNQDFKYFNLEEITEECFSDFRHTGNDLFDEFWFNWVDDESTFGTL